MSFHEKSAWACLGGIIAVFVPYFFIVFQYPMAFVGLFGMATVGLGVLLTAFHIVNAIATRSIRVTGDTPAQDELDRLIELRAAKMSGIVLGFVVVSWTLLAMFGVPTLGVVEFMRERAADDMAAPKQFVIPVFQALTAIHLLFAGFVVANVVYYTCIVTGYRRLAHG